MTRRPPRLTTTSTLLPRTMRFLALLPPFAVAASDWRDGCFDCLVLDPFGGTQPPRELILLARGIAARRPLLILSDRDSRADRMLALGAGADAAVGWAENPLEVVARLASLCRPSRLAAGQPGPGEQRESGG